MISFREFSPRFIEPRLLSRNIGVKILHKYGFQRSDYLGRIGLVYRNIPDNSAAYEVSPPQQMLVNIQLHISGLQNKEAGVLVTRQFTESRLKKLFRNHIFSYYNLRKQFASTSTKVNYIVENCRVEKNKPDRTVRLHKTQYQQVRKVINNNQKMSLFQAIGAIKTVQGLFGNNSASYERVFPEGLYEKPALDPVNGIFPGEQVVPGHIPSVYRPVKHHRYLVPGGLSMRTPGESRTVFRQVFGGLRHPRAQEKSVGIKLLYRETPAGVKPPEEAGWTEGISRTGTLRLLTSGYTPEKLMSLLKSAAPGTINAYKNQRVAGGLNNYFGYSRPVGGLILPRAPKLRPFMAIDGQNVSLFTVSPYAGLIQKPAADIYVDIYKEIILKHIKGGAWNQPFKEAALYGHSVRRYGSNAWNQPFREAAPVREINKGKIKIPLRATGIREAVKVAPGGAVINLVNVLIPGKMTQQEPGLTTGLKPQWKLIVRRFDKTSLVPLIQHHISREQDPGKHNMQQIEAPESSVTSLKLQTSTVLRHKALAAPTNYTPGTSFYIPVIIDRTKKSAKSPGAQTDLIQKAEVDSHYYSQLKSAHFLQLLKQQLDTEMRSIKNIRGVNNWPVIRIDTPLFNQMPTNLFFLRANTSGVKLSHRKKIAPGIELPGGAVWPERIPRTNLRGLLRRKFAPEKLIALFIQGARGTIAAYKEQRAADRPGKAFGDSRPDRGLIPKSPVKQQPFPAMPVDGQEDRLLSARQLVSFGQKKSGIDIYIGKKVLNISRHKAFTALTEWAPNTIFCLPGVIAGDGHDINSAGAHKEIVQIAGVDSQYYSRVKGINFLQFHTIKNIIRDSGSIKNTLDTNSRQLIRIDLFKQLFVQMLAMLPHMREIAAGIKSSKKAGGLGEISRTKPRRLLRRVFIPERLMALLIERARSTMDFQHLPVKAADGQKVRQLARLFGSFEQSEPGIDIYKEVNPQYVKSGVWNYYSRDRMPVHEETKGIKEGPKVARGKATKIADGPGQLDIKQINIQKGTFAHLKPVEILTTLRDKVPTALTFHVPYTMLTLPGIIARIRDITSRTGAQTEIIQKPGVGSNNYTQLKRINFLKLYLRHIDTGGIKNIRDASNWRVSPVITDAFRDWNSPPEFGGYAVSGRSGGLLREDFRIQFAGREHELYVEQGGEIFRRSNIKTEGMPEKGERNVEWLTRQWIYNRPNKGILNFRRNVEPQYFLNLNAELPKLPHVDKPLAIKTVAALKDIIKLYLTGWRWSKANVPTGAGFQQAVWQKENDTDSIKNIRDASSLPVRQVIIPDVFWGWNPLLKFGRYTVPRKSGGLLHGDFRAQFAAREHGLYVEQGGGIFRGSSIKPKGLPGENERVAGWLVGQWIYNSRDKGTLNFRRNVEPQYFPQMNAELQRSPLADKPLTVKAVAALNDIIKLYLVSPLSLWLSGNRNKIVKLDELIRITVKEANVPQKVNFFREINTARSVYDISGKAGGIGPVKLVRPGKRMYKAQPGQDYNPVPRLSSRRDDPPVSGGRALASRRVLKMKHKTIMVHPLYSKKYNIAQSYSGNLILEPGTGAAAKIPALFYRIMNETINKLIQITRVYKERKSIIRSRRQPHIKLAVAVKPVPSYAVIRRLQLEPFRSKSYNSRYGHPLPFIFNFHHAAVVEQAAQDGPGRTVGIFPVKHRGIVALKETYRKLLRVKSLLQQIGKKGEQQVERSRGERSSKFILHKLVYYLNSRLSNAISDVVFRRHITQTAIKKAGLDKPLKSRRTNDTNLFKLIAERHLFNKYGYNIVSRTYLQERDFLKFSTGLKAAGSDVIPVVQPPAFARPGFIGGYRKNGAKWIDKSANRIVSPVEHKSGKKIREIGAITEKKLLQTSKRARLIYKNDFSGRTPSFAYGPPRMDFVAPARPSEESAGVNKLVKKPVQTEVTMGKQKIALPDLSKMDLNKIVDKVYREIEKKIKIERQRRGL